MVSAVYYFVTPEDQATLLDYLGEPTKVTLRPWSSVGEPTVRLTREDALRASQVMIASLALGSPVTIRPRDPAMEENSKAGGVQPHQLEPDATRGPGGGHCGQQRIAGSLLAARGCGRGVSVDERRWLSGRPPCADLRGV